LAIPNSLELRSSKLILLVCPACYEWVLDRPPASGVLADAHHQRGNPSREIVQAEVPPGDALVVTEQLVVGPGQPPPYLAALPGIEPLETHRA
jgi:hypothetical protein